MIISLLSFTDKGEALANKIASGFGKKVSCNVSRCGEGELSSWTESAFASSDAIIFVGASGIAVRAIAPFIDNKLKDPAVLVIDELGQHIVPLLSGHVGGANQLAEKIGDILGGNSDLVITTATDVNHKFSIDVWAKEHNLIIYEKSGIKHVAAKLLKGEEVLIGSDVAITYKRDEKAVLTLIPPVVVGIGCKKDTSFHIIKELFDRILEENNIIPEAISCVASIDIKAGEEGIVKLAGENNVPFNTYSASELRELQGAFSESKFVMDKVGVGNVCERSAVIASRKRFGSAKLIVKKTAHEGVTIAMAIPKEESLQEELRRALEDNTMNTLNSMIDFAIGNNGSSDNTSDRNEANSDINNVNSNNNPDTNSNDSSVINGRTKPGFIKVVGMGAGNYGCMTIKAIKAIEAADRVVGYTKYVELVKEIFPGKECYATGMMQEVERCKSALDMALSGENIAIVCSGDAGVYGMSGLVLELAGEDDIYSNIDIQVVPGVTAALSGAAVLGAPLMHDFSVISLSDLMTPWEVIEKRLDAAGSSDMSVVLYNPSSKKRSDYLYKACEILLKYKSADTVCGVVSNIGRTGEESKLMTLGELKNAETDMFTTVFIGNSNTKNINGKMVTPRGYKF